MQSPEEVFSAGRRFRSRSPLCGSLARETGKTSSAVHGASLSSVQYRAFVRTLRLPVDAPCCRSNHYETACRWIHTAWGQFNHSRSASIATWGWRLACLRLRGLAPPCDSSSSITASCGKATRHHKTKHKCSAQTFGSRTGRRALLYGRSLDSCASEACLKTADMLPPDNPA